MNILEFANPSGWWWAALAIPILLLYILKIRLRRQTVPTLLFWDRLFDEKKPRAWWQRLRHLLSLLLQLAFVALLVAALLDPLWSWQKNQQRHIVLVVDNSASMQAIEQDGASRLDAARASAGVLIRSMRSGDRMAVLSAGGRSNVVLGMTDYQRALLEAVDTLPATDGPTDVTAAVAAAERLLADDEQGEIVVLTDGCLDDLEALQANERVKIYGVGGPQDNLAITRYQVRRSLLDAIGYQVLLDVTNFSDEPRDCRVELTLSDDLVDVLPLEIEPGATVTRILDHTSAAGGELVAKLDTTDALATDDTGVAVLPKRTPVPVQLVSEGNLFLQGVLESIPLVDLQVTTEAPSVAPAEGILVLDRVVPQQLPAGRVIVVDPQGSCDAWTLGEPMAQPIVASVDEESPLTQHVRLDNVLFPGARQLNFTGPVDPLIQDPLDSPLLARIRRGGGDAVVLSCNLEKGDLPLRIAFPVLMKNTIEWFQGNSGELRPALATGRMVSLDVSSTATDAPQQAPVAENDDEPEDLAVVESAETTTARPMELISPTQQTIPLATTDDQVTIGPLLETGLWTVRPAKENDGNAALTNTSAGQDDASVESDDDPSVIRVACNLVNLAESDLRPRGELDDVEGRGLLTLGGQSLWFYLTLLAAALIAAEWWLYQRRIVG
ncbi:MAG: VWA domain-containing protein [Planctomycetota bacterium]|mgnify:CR=1 FL=1|nr:MAG: VWA domain-containing protein [Planctomycetota bacterium]